MKKMICWVSLLCLLAVSAFTALAESGKHTVTEQAMDFYMMNDVVQRSVCFIDGSDVPYLALSDWPAILGLLWNDPDEMDPGSALVGMTFSIEDSVGRLTRTDGYYVDFDCDADVIRFLDYDGFMRDTDNKFLIDIMDYGYTLPDGSVQYYHRDPASYERYGKAVEINAGDYGIDFIAEDNECYVPLQTLSDILLSAYYMNVFYNGEAVFFVGYRGLGDAEELTPIGEAFYSVKPRTRSEAMARFTYSELCLALDALYGLKENHRIDSFDALAEETGLKPALTGTDPAEADAALYQLLEIHLGDRHTVFSASSPLSGVHAGEDFSIKYGLGMARADSWEQRDLYLDTRSKVYPNGVPSYEEIGNTAYITFDEFITVTDENNYYENPPTAEAEDTIGIMLYAYGQITRENSPIENVVLDLSCNRGGDSDAGIFTLAAFLGTGSISSRNTLSDAMATGNYQVDMNLDGRIDEKDLGLKDKNLFCMESPCSFSCGNLVPCAFKASNKVTLIGRTSGGGACVVLPMSTADGACFQISGPIQLAFMKNGSFYDIDQGAEPDISLMKPASFYDRQALTEYINEVR